MRNPSLVTIGLFLGASLVAGPGCVKCGEDATRRIAESAMEKAVEAGSGGKADIEMGKDVDLSGMPDEAKYPGAKGTGRFAISTGEGTGVTYSLETGDAPGKVIEWYRSSVERAGWTKSAEMETGEASMVIFAKEAEKKMLNVTVSTDAGRTTIAIVYGQDAE